MDQESYSEGDVDFKTQLTSILGKNPEMVFCPNYYQEVGQILAQAESVGLTVPFLGGDGWDGLEGYATADQLKDSYFCACYAKAPAPRLRMLQGRVRRGLPQRLCTLGLRCCHDRRVRHQGCRGAGP